ncbi:hypothetical protein [Aquabacterium sp. CECT 9606]|uniref:hypothetical protein n=1 Tax=Aquabacterium sp. CECT 9606 TaxID=2845822 RepID=UPI001E3DB782|nr:hypothetical protein [Aquabacterium sp. CECT 9606]
MQQENAQRPKAVIVFQLMGALITCLLTVGAVRTTAGLIQFWANNGIPILLINLSQWLALAALAFTLVKLFKAKPEPITRWLGLLFIALLYAFIFNIQFLNKSKSEPFFKCSDPATGELGELLGGALQLLAILYWFYAYGFSLKARNFFAQATASHVEKTGST